MAQAAYRFLPWARRGLSAALATPDVGQDLDQRARLSAGLTVTGAGAHGVDLALYGPGDVIGLDPRLVIRTDPKPHSTDCEPNYLAGIEFDLPELPWLFTPASASPQDHLRPWLVLVVLDTSGPQKVELPQVQSGRPLPFVQLSAQQVAEQLPDLAESWGWAHSQLLGEKGMPGDNATALGGNPHLNLSRLICPRRLVPMTSYMACLVPAFDVGVTRGLGGAPQKDAKVKPAWRPDQPAAMDLPVYFHWTFATGPQGDFESLARELKPFKCPPTVGTTSMFIWDSLPGLMDATPASTQEKPVWMDGALRASEKEPATLSEIDGSFQAAITSEVNASADIADRSNPDATRAISAPLYGGFHAKAVRVPAGTPKWLKELNVDPRARAAAGLAADVVRANQDVFMQACWEQVGKVLEANALLNQSRLATEALDRLQRRITSLPPAVQIALTAPVLGRILLNGLTITTTVARSSMPDALLSPTFRRLASPARAALKRAGALGAETPAVALVTRLARGSLSVDPNQFIPDGVANVRSLDALELGGHAGDLVDLASIGLATTVRTQEVLQVQNSIAAIRDVPLPLTTRPDVVRTGLVTSLHVDRLGNSLSVSSLGEALDVMLEVSARSTRAGAFLLEKGAEGQPSISVIDVSSDGQVWARTPSGQPDRVLASFGQGFSARTTREFADALAQLPDGLLGAGASPLLIMRDAGGRVVGGDMSGLGRGRRFQPRVPSRDSHVLPDLVKDPNVLSAFANAFSRTVDGLALDRADQPLQIISFDLAAAANATAARVDPRKTIPARLASMIQLGGIDLFDAVGGTVAVAPSVDRIMCAPSLLEPAYLRLARLDNRAFLPGIEAIPPNTLTLLETNPRFIEAYMVGLNHEMNRELLWRSYPTDQRGTPFRHFWDWADGGADIGDIHAFANLTLGHNTRGGAVGGNLVLLVRGNLLRRYPNSTLSAWRAVQMNGRRVLKPDPGPGDYLPAAFFGNMEPDVSFAGFELTRPEIVTGEGWFFVIEQQVTEPRFGFDEETRDAVAANPANWRDARWIDTGATAGRHLSLAGRLAGHSVNGVTFARDAGHMAAAALQRPFRLAVHASHLTQI